MILVLDNYDSFTYNLVQLLGQLEAGQICVKRNDELSLQAVKDLRANRVLISPGPGRPENAGISVEMFSGLPTNIPILGVCLGHQALGVACGGEVIQAQQRLHGKVSKIYHDHSQLFQGLSNPFLATRYHSLIVKEDTMPADLLVTAWTSDGEIMALQHRSLPHFGVQFHPESILTPEGSRLLRNFLDVQA